MAGRIISKVSTLDAARTIFFIVVGLAIKQSLGLFGHTWPSRELSDAPPEWGLLVRVIICLGYLCTVIRYSHGVTLLYGHEKERIENQRLPSASKVSALSLFLVLLAIPFFLMADNIGNLRAYVICTGCMLAIDLLYIWRSEIVRAPLRRLRLQRIRQRRSDTERGTGPHAALWWMASDVMLIGVCIAFLIRTPLGSALDPYPAAPYLLFSGWLILFTVLDYYHNWDFYFGGRDDRRQQKFVFVCSPLRAEKEEVIGANINRAQLYCLNLMKRTAWRGQKITPFASHAFFTYFLNDNVPEDRALARECAVAYLSACDAIYAYAPQVADEPGKPSPRYKLSAGMAHEVDEAKRFGLEIKYLAETMDQNTPEGWQPPRWNKITYAQKLTVRKRSENYFRSAEQRKKVYVCTRFRGPQSKPGKDWEAQKKTLRDNTSLALWHCHELARDVDEAVAPFAPQAFYPYFWKFTNESGIVKAQFDEWFERSIEVLKVCDAVYVYTTDGMPPTDTFDPAEPESDNASEGMRRVVRTAKSLGLEIQYRKELCLPAEDEEIKELIDEAGKKLRLAQENLDDLRRRVRGAKADAEEAQARAEELANDMPPRPPGVGGNGARAEAARAGGRTVKEVVEDPPESADQQAWDEKAALLAEAVRRARKAREEAARLAVEVLEAEAKVSAAKEEVAKCTWSPALPEF
jgi:hypothetical protein